jgi:hypothetical protein
MFMTEQQDNQKDADREGYEAIGVDQLLMYCAKQVLTKREECTLERLVYECFTRFPRKFALSRYPQWPDSTRVYRSWRRCLGVNKWLAGSPQEGFRITDKGEKIAQAIGVKLQDPGLDNLQRRESSRSRGKEEAITRYLRKSGAFGRWRQDRESFKVSESELRSILNATLETPLETLKDNIVYYRENAEFVKDFEVVEFLDECCQQHEDVLGG